MGTQLQTNVGPGIEVVLSSDGATNTAALADRPVLVEGRGALNGGSVFTSSLVDLVGAAIALDGAELGSAGGGIVVAVLVNDVVFDEGVLGPAIERDVAVAVALPLTAVGHSPSNTLLLVSVGFLEIFRGVSYLALPGFHPFPATKLSQLVHLTLYWPPLPLVYSTSPPPLVQKE